MLAPLHSMRPSKCRTTDPPTYETEVVGLDISIHESSVKYAFDDHGLPQKVKIALVKLTFPHGVLPEA